MPYVESHSNLDPNEANPHIQKAVADALGTKAGNVIIDNRQAYWGEGVAPITLQVEATTIKITDELRLEVEIPEGTAPKDAAAYAIAKLLAKRFPQGGEPEVALNHNPDMKIHFPGDELKAKN